MSSHSSIGFSGDDHAEPGLDPYYQRMNPPDNEIPVGVPVSMVIARGDNAAVGLLGVHAYTTGVAFTLAFRLRRRPAATDTELHALLGGWRTGVDDDRSSLLIGVEFSDARRTFNTDPTRLGRTPDPEMPLLQPCAGGGGDISYDQNYFLSPLPPDGPLRLVCRCPAIGIQETIVDLDGTAIRQAGRSSTVLWPLPPIDEPGELPPQPLPDEGWFATFRDDSPRQSTKPPTETD